MFSSLEKEIIANMIAEATHEVLTEDEVDFTLDVWESKDDIEEEENNYDNF